MNTMTLKLAGAAILASLAVAETPAATIYQDNFNRIGDLNGSTPTVTTDGNVWHSTNWSTNGSEATTSAAGYLANIPFTPVQGKVYTMTLSMNPNGGGADSDWFAFGLTNRYATDNWFVDDQSSVSIFPRWKNNQYPDFYTNGPGSTGITSLGSFTENVAHDYSIILDTTNATAANWTAEYKVDGVTIIAATALGYTPTINYIGFGSGGATGTVDNFSLTVVPEPASLALLGLGAVALLRRRRA